MRLPILSLFLIAAALLGEIPAASAQSATSYPWCAKYYKEGSPTSCWAAFLRSWAFLTSQGASLGTVGWFIGLCGAQPSHQQRFKNQGFAAPKQDLVVRHSDLVGADVQFDVSERQDRRDE
jgi:hypothetical protein